MRFSSPSPWPLSLNVVLQSFSLKNGSIMFIMISTLISFLCLWQEEAVFFSLFGLQRIELIFWYSIYNNTYHKQYKEKFLTLQHFVNIYKMITIWKNGNSIQIITWMFGYEMFKGISKIFIKILTSVESRRITSHLTNQVMSMLQS